MEVVRYKGRHWAVYDEEGELIVVTVYKRGAQEVKRRLSVSSEPAAEISVVRLGSLRDSPNEIYRTSDNGDRLGERGRVVFQTGRTRHKG